MLGIPESKQILAPFPVLCDISPSAFVHGLLNIALLLETSISNYALNSWKWVPVSQSFFVSQNGWSPFWMFICSFIFVLKVPLLDTRLKSWWLTGLVVGRTVRCQNSLQYGMRGSVPHTYPPHILKTPVMAPISAQGRCSLGLFLTGPHPVCFADWHSTEPYMTVLCRCSSTGFHEFSWSLPSDWEQRQPPLYLLRSPQHHQSLSYSCLNVNEQTKFAESEGWKVEEFEWKLWTAKTGPNLALNFVLRTAVRKPQTSKMPAMGDLCLNISQLDLLHQGLPAPTRCSTCSWLAFVSLWQFQIHIQTLSHLCYCTHQVCPLVSVPPSTPKPPPPWSLPWLHFMPDQPNSIIPRRSCSHFGFRRMLSFRAKPVSPDILSILQGQKPCLIPDLSHPTVPRTMEQIAMLRP